MSMDNFLAADKDNGMPMTGSASCSVPDKSTGPRVSLVAFPEGRRNLMAQLL
jgi:hypothetical protein